jgi:hypothetical protein
MKYNLAIILLSAIFICASCEKEAELTIENEGIPLLVKEIYSDNLYWEYTYNEANLPKEVKTKFCYTSYLYNNDNQLTSYDFYEDGRIYSSDWATADSALKRKEWVTPQNTKLSARGIYSYHHGKLEHITVYQQRFNSQSSTTFEYDGNGRIGRQTFYSDNAPSGYMDYVYDETGNMILQKHYVISEDNPILITSTAYEFDDNPNPFIPFRKLMNPGRYTNENNIVRETLTFFIDVPGVDKVQVTESTYEYNDQGYPVKKNNLVRYEYK